MHFQQPVAGTVSCDDFYTGTRAALAGGTTTVLDVVMPERGESLVDAHAKWAGWADQKACCDYGLHVAVTWWSEKVRGRGGKWIGYRRKSGPYCGLKYGYYRGGGARTSKCVISISSQSMFHEVFNQSSIVFWHFFHFIALFPLITNIIL